MELICYTFQISDNEESKVDVVVSLGGAEKVSINFSIITLNNCSIRNIQSRAKNWENYFKIKEDEKEKVVYIEALTSGTINYTRSKD